MTEETNPGTTFADKLYSRILNIYLDERDNRIEDQLGLKPNDFTKATVIKDYPIPNRKVQLHVRRRPILMQKAEMSFSISILSIWKERRCP